MNSHFSFDQRLIDRYDRPGPRYTSYPTAVQFRDDFTVDDYRAAAGRSRALSLYFHIPFCDTICFYCACNKIATKDRSKSEPYLQALDREMALQAAIFNQGQPVEQLHWGGGTPTFLNNDQMRWLMARTRSHYNLLDDDSGEYSIEIDPREVRPDTLEVLREIGFNRMSLGLQDLDEAVQRAVNRIQSAEQTFGTMQRARELGFRSVSLDLIYGLPKQTLASFERTLEAVIAERPDRLSIFNYAHMPERFKPQRRIEAADLPAPQTKLDILQMAGEKLQEAGYVYIGMDHFALPDDELALAQREGHLYRNFQGYSTHAHCDLLGFGVSAIGSVGNTYAQNVKDLASYYAAIERGELPIERGLVLSRDDEIRRGLITELICNFRLDFAEFGRQWEIDTPDYFAEELKRLESMQADGLVVLDGEGIRVTDSGRLLIRNICMVFDAYLDQAKARFSRVI
ncbi:MAG: oxygen-independent coproporphyrinogen III oxidase [Gammaproteobacteria bacterium]|nr:MAG: oxygen-independent coproporphyrinogen III oxidase [Gammaproteobacteria bacterium]